MARFPVLAPLVLALLGAAAVGADRVAAETELLRARAEAAALRQRLAEAGATDELRRLEAAAALRAARLEAEAAAGEAERAALGRAAALEAARASAADALAAARRGELEADLRLAQAESALALAKADANLALVAARRRAAEVVPGDIERPAEPFKDGVLRISDRRIEFNGRVDQVLADRVCAEIAFHNNRDAAAPIFLVIDNSPGGSVMAGYQVLRAMETSRAPVHVVVKGSAASMAAVIATLAERSYCFPGTLLMHHQPSFGLQGNLRQLREQYDWSKVWCDRINREVAAKVGMSLDEFVRRMYAATVTGDWRVTGEEAVRLRWVGTLVERIQEDGVTELAQPARLQPTVTVVRPASGPAQDPLPPALPGDAWLIHEPLSR
jgi:ATP-dependent Clp protease protease subunit